MRTRQPNENNKTSKNELKGDDNNNPFKTLKKGSVMSISRTKMARKTKIENVVKADKNLGYE
jgi:hypothetical protein